MATLEKVNPIEITLTDGILSISHEYKTGITIPVRYVPILIQMIKEECYQDKKEREASNG